jgi:hypothetical protein
MTGTNVAVDGEVQARITTPHSIDNEPECDMGCAKHH